MKKDATFSFSLPISRIAIYIWHAIWLTLMCQLSAKYCVITIVCAIISHALHLVVLLTEYPIVTGPFYKTSKNLL